MPLVAELHAVMVTTMPKRLTKLRMGSLLERDKRQTRRLGCPRKRGYELRGVAATCTLSPEPMSRYRYSPMIADAFNSRHQMPMMGSIWEDAWDDTGGAVLDAVSKIPGVGPYLSTALATALSTVAGPAILTELFTTAPGIGQTIATALVTLGPVANQMLPGLTRGERVDKVFIQSVKSVAARAASAGGAGAAADAAGEALTSSVAVANDALAQVGTSAEDLAAYSDSLRVASGLKLSTDQLPALAQRQLDAHVNAILAKINPATIAATVSAKLGRLVPDDVVQTAIDGVTRSVGYNAANFEPKTGARINLGAGYAANAAAAANTAALNAGYFANAVNASNAAADAAAQAASMNAQTQAAIQAGVMQAQTQAAIAAGIAQASPAPVVAVSKPAVAVAAAGGLGLLVAVARMLLL